MATLGPADLLAAWDNVRASRPDRPHWTARNALLLEAFGVTDPGAGDPDSVGRRQAELLRLYVANFGERVDGVARCPRCATDVELSVPVAELTAGLPVAQEIEPLRLDGHTVHWRLPTGADIVAAAAAVDSSEGAVLLMSRCVVRSDAPAADLPAPLRAVLAERISAADPYLDIVLTLCCPDCAEAWDSPLDVGEFAWAALRSRAHQLIRDVDELARAYGWSETDILALSDVRRGAYLELVRDG